MGDALSTGASGPLGCTGDIPNFPTGCSIVLPATFDTGLLDTPAFLITLPSLADYSYWFCIVLGKMAWARQYSFNISTLMFILALWRYSIIWIRRLGGGY